MRLTPAPIFGTITLTGTNVRNEMTDRTTRSSSDLRADLHVMEKAVEFRYAAQRQEKVLLVAMLPRWQYWLITTVLRVRP